MAKMLLHGIDARRALARGVARLAAAVEPTLGPRGQNAMVDRPVGSPMITRDGVSIAAEVELADRFENMGAQVAREVSMQTNESAGDGTSTAVVLANALVQSGLALTEGGAKTVDLCAGIDLAVERVVAQLQGEARPLDLAADAAAVAAVADIAATEPALGALVAEAFAAVGGSGVVEAEYGVEAQPRLELLEGMSFDRGYVSHHLVTDKERMLVELESPLILMTDLKIERAAQLDNARAIAAQRGQPLLVVAEAVAPEVLAALLADGEPGRYLIVHPPEYGHWRKALLEDMAILTGGRVLARDLGAQIEGVQASELGQSGAVRSSATATSILRGAGDPERVAARRLQVQQLLDAAPPNIEQDKLRERLAKLTGGSASVHAGGQTPVEKARRAQLVDDAIAAVRAALEGGVVAGGGTALARAGAALDAVPAGAQSGVLDGLQLVRESLSAPLRRIAQNAGRSGDQVLHEVLSGAPNTGFNARERRFEDLFAAGVIDPVRVSCSALVNAASVAKLVLSTDTLIGDLREGEDDPTAGPARGGGAEALGRP